MKRTDIRWNLVFEFNRMNLVQDERTEQEAEKDRKISLVWTAALLAILLWPFRDEGALRWVALVDLCAVALRAVLDWRALHGGNRDAARQQKPQPDRQPKQAQQFAGCPQPADGSRFPSAGMQPVRRVSGAGADPCDEPGQAG